MTFKPPLLASFLPLKKGDQGGFHLASMRKSPLIRLFQKGKKFRCLTCEFLQLVAILVFLAAPSLLPAQNLPAEEKQKIETLIKQVGDLKDANFVRNGSAYEPSTAVRFLRGKWNANKAEVHSARDFIDKVASMSGTSGKPYLIRFKDGKEIPSREFLLAVLNKIAH